MSDEHDEDVPDIHEIHVSEPAPSPIHFLDKDFEYETDIVESWLVAAKEEGAINENESVTTKSIAAVMRSVKRQDLIPSELTEKEATIMFMWWYGFSAGYSYYEYKQKQIMAQAMMGAASQMLGIDNPNPFLEDEDDENKDTDGNQ